MTRSSPLRGSRSSSFLADARTAFWHFRHGGLREVRVWRRRRQVDGRTADARGSEARGENARPLTFAPAELPSRSPRFSDLRVAAILDEFSMLAWSYEFDLLAVTPDRWEQQVAESPVDLLLVESAWHGNSDAWQYQLTGSNAPSEPLRALVAHCRERGIPTVFWNKEDPPHFEDFLETARLFDHVFTTDVTLIPQYEQALGHDRVSVLPFAAQPAIHNPVRPQHGYQERDVAFAGMYFAHKFPERREQMDMLLGGALDASARMERGLEIFSRFLGDDERYQFPGPLGERVVGSLPYRSMLTAYKAFKVFLNVNSVVTSPSMCARRIFEITASGTPVVSTWSPAVREFFRDDEVPVVRSREDAAHMTRALVRSAELRDRMVHRAQRRIWRSHTYAERALRVLAASGLEDRVRHSASLPTVSVLAATNRPHQLEHLLAQVGRQRHVDVQLVLVTHGFAAPDDLAARAGAVGIHDVIVIEAPSTMTLGACLNAAAGRASGDVLAKMDDDDLYGPWYLHDQLRALEYSGADIVGKQAHYMYVEGTDATLLRFPWREHRYTDRIMGPTITGKRHVFEQHPFEDRSLGEDTAFLRAASEGGAIIYSADRFQFMQMRRSAPDHSWDVADRDLMSTGDTVWFGRNAAHVMA